MSSAPDPTKEIKITNSSKSPIVLMLPTTSSQTTDANGTMVYDQALEIVKAVDGSTTVPTGSTKTFLLDQTYVNPSTGKSAYSTVYDLLPCTANWYSPVANIGVMQSFATPPSYPAQTVTAANAKAFQDAATFVQTIAAYPTTALATQYQQALNQAQTNASGQANGSANSATATAASVTNTVNQFFKSTKSFQDVTLQAVVAVQSYYGTFPFVWAEYATGTTTYYLYSSNGTATSFVGTIALTPPAALDISKPNAGYTCTFTPASNGSDTTTVAVNTAAAKSLTYTGGLFVDDVNSDLPQIAVKGTFQIKSLFTTKPADTQIITVLSGTINGSTCIGFDSAQLSSNPDDSFWDTLFHPKTAAQIFQSVMEIGGFLMLLVFAGQSIYGIAKWARSLAAEKQPTTKELLDEHLAKLQESIKANADPLVKKVSGGKESAPANAEEAATQVKDSTSTIADSESAAKLESGFSAQADNLQTMAEFAEDMNSEQLDTLEGLGTQVQESVQELQDADPASLGSVVAEQTTNLSSVSEGFGSLQTEVSSLISETQASEIQANQELVTEAQKDAQSSQESDEDAPGDDDPKGDPIDVPDAI